MADIVELLFHVLTSAIVAGALLFPPRKEPLRTDATLCDAASVGDRRQIKLLLMNGVDPDSADEEGTTGLMAAVFAGRISATRDLLKAGANPNIQDVSGMTALMNAVIASSELDLGETHPIFRQIVQLLLDHGANVDLEDGDGLTAADHARALGLVDLVAELRG